jgi:hypothetical protein
MTFGFRITTSFIGLLLVVFSFVPIVVFADSPDMSIRSSDIWFSESVLIVGDEIRIYAEIDNKGDVDIAAHVFFYQGDEPIGASQTVSIPHGGDDDAVWVDFTVPSGAFNVRAEIQGQTPADTNSSNDLAVTALFHPIFDQDHDGVEDSDDNCLEIENPSQEDTDSDDIGDVCDDDDDNDGITDDLEQEIGTDDQLADTDGDTIQDLQDDQPLNPAVTQEPGVVEDSEGVGEVDENSLLEERDAYGIIKTSTNANFSYQLIAWKVYDFQSLLDQAEGSTIAWDFGDGVTSAQTEVQHTFREIGSYTVTSTVVDKDGQVYEDTAEIQVTFFHMSNPLVRFIIGLLLLIFVVSLFAALWRKKDEE